MYRIPHNSPSPIQCLRAFHILFSAYLLFRCYCYNYYKNPKTFTFSVATVTIIIIPLLLLNTLLQILSYPGVVELTTQLLILKNILWLPLCRINKFGLNTLPSKAVVIPYTCGLPHHRPQPPVHHHSTDHHERLHGNNKQIDYKNACMHQSHTKIWHDLPWK